MNITNWILGLWHKKRMKKLKGLSFKMKIETDALKSNCITEIQNGTFPLWLSIQKLKYQLGIKTVQNIRARITKDIFDKEVVLSNPVFCENQIAEIKSKHWLYVATIIGFTVAESFLYYLTAALFVPGGSEVMKISVAIFLALLIMFALGYAFEKHFLYREAVERNSKGEISGHQLKHFRDTRNFGYVLIALSFIGIIFSGFARIFFLENIPANGLSAEKLHSIRLASLMASIFTMIVTILAAFFMALLKQEQVKLGIRYRVYSAWHSSHVIRNEYTQALIKDAHSIMLVVERAIEKYWQLVIDLKRIFRMDTEYDPKEEALYAEYIELKSKPGFLMNADVYRKFTSIQCVDEELFKYGIFNNIRLVEKITEAKLLLSIPEDHLAEHLAVLPKTEEYKLLLNAPHSNGQAKEHEFKTN